MTVPTIRGFLPCLAFLALGGAAAQPDPGASERTLVLEVASPHDSLSFTSDWWGESDPYYWISTAANPHSLLRFEGVEVPRGATMLGATLTVWSYNVAVDDPADHVTVWMEQVDDAAPVASPAEAWGRKDSRGLDAVWPTTNGGRGRPQPSPDLSAMLQQIVDRPGWSSGNAVLFFAAGTSTPAHDGRQAHSYYTGTAGETRATLEVRWAVASSAAVRAEPPAELRTEPLAAAMR